MKASLMHFVAAMTVHGTFERALHAFTASIFAASAALADARLPPKNQDLDQNGVPLRVLLDRGDGRFAGFVTLAQANELRVDMKFWAKHPRQCAAAFSEPQGDDAWGWSRMCEDAARYGILRLAGNLSAGLGGREFSGTLAAGDRGFNIDATFRVVNDCVREIGVRGTAGTYAFFAVDCSEAGGAGKDSRTAPFWPTDGNLANALDNRSVSNRLNTSYDQESGKTSTGVERNGLSPVAVPLSPGKGHSRANSLGPIKGTDDDLFPKNGFGYLLDLLPRNEPPLAVIQLARSDPGNEQIVFDSYAACHSIPSEVSRDFCAMASALEGNSVQIADYGFNGQYGLGRFEFSDDTWFVRLRGLPDHRLEAEFIRTRLHLDSELGINPKLSDAPAVRDNDGRRYPVAKQDLYPLEGFGHILAFIENRMEMPATRKNRHMQSGDLVLGSDKRLHIAHFGRCPPEVNRRFCEETRRSVNRSWPLENYLFNGVIGSAEMTYGGVRYMVVLSKSDSGLIRAQFYLANSEGSARFRTHLGPRESSKATELSELTCIGQFRGETRIFEKLTNHRNVPVSWCAANGSCADGQDLSYLQALCELALREEQRVFSRWAHFDGADAIWGKACARPGAQADAVALVPYGGNRFDTSSIHFGITAPYLEDAEVGRLIGQNGQPEYIDCSNCKTVGKLACEFFEP